MSPASGRSTASVTTRLRAGIGLLGLCLLVCLPVTAQHGHPLVGSWSGDWTAPGDRRQRLLLVLEYEEDTISGSVYFGTRRVPLGRATLDPTSWTVRLEAMEEDANGEDVDYLIEGRIGNLGSTTERSISGSLTRNGERGAFRVVMN